MSGAGGSDPSHATRYRPDIDGLRAVAVTAVVLYHALAWLVPSGFVGVDVFFVISGYLIGGIIHGAVAARRFSFATFYARRARRILPALIVVVSCCAVAAFAFMTAREAVEFGEQAVAALLGLSNLWFWKHVSYFATAADQQPLLMTWSLGVEEQFYLLFPVLMLLLAWLGRRRQLMVVLFVTAASLAVSIILTGRAPGAAFYLLPPRAWELGVGAALAIVHQDRPASARWSGRGEEVLAVLCAAALCVSLFAFDGDTPFPGVAAVLPVLATAGLIQTRHAAFNRRILGSRPMVAIGLISYSWYLWHWPLMAFARRAVDRAPSDAQMLVIALISLLLGAASWRWIEQPFRRATAPDGVTLRRYALALAAALALPLAFVLGHGWPGRLPARVASITAGEAGGRTCIAPYGVGTLPADPGCYPAGATVAVLGDSHAAALTPGLIDAAARQGVTVADLTKSSCSPLPGFVPVIAAQPGHVRECDQFRRAAIARIVADPAIRVVVVAAFWANLHNLRMVRVDGGDAVPAQVAVAAGLSELTAAVTRAGKQVLLVGPVPSPGFDPANRLIGETVPARRLVRDLLRQQNGGDRRFPLRGPTAGGEITSAFLAAQAQRLGIAYLDTARQLCGDGTCRYAAGDTPLYSDTYHLSPFGSRQLRWPSTATDAR